VASDPPEAPQAPPPPPPQPQERRERVEVHLGGAPEPSPAPKGSTRDPVVRSLSRPGSPYPHDEDTDRYVVRQHPIPTPDEETGPHAAVRPVDRGTLWIVAAFFIGGALLAGIWFLWRGLE